MLKLTPFRSKAAGTPDLLNYAALIDNGVVLNKDGSLLAGFFFRGDDAASATNAERNYLTALVNNYISKLGSGWAIWVDAIRLPSPGYPSPESSHFPEPITALIDAERRSMFKNQNYFESEYALTLQYLPPYRRESKITELVYSEDTKDTSLPADKILEEFKRHLSDIEDGLGDYLHMRRMGTVEVVIDGDKYNSDELVNYLHYTLTGEIVALKIPDCPMYLDSWIGYPELWPGDNPKIGDKFIACVAVEGFPGESFPGILDMLDGLPIACRWTSRFIFLEQHEALSALNRYRLKWQQKIRGFMSQVFNTQKGMVNTDALEMAQQSEAAMNDVKSGVITYGYYTPVVVIMHENRRFLQEQARYIRREIVRRGFSSRIETVNSMEAWLGSLPGQAFYNIRRPLIHTLSLSDMLPLASVWPGLKENPCGFFEPNSPPLMRTVTTGETPFRLNLHVDDVGHTLVFGPTGAGKSTLLATLIAQFRRYRSRQLVDGSRLPATVIAFDKGNSLYALCKATGGKHYDIGSDGDTTTLMPLADIDGNANLLWAEEWISTCFKLQVQRPPSPDQLGKIHRALKLMQQSPPQFRSITEFVSNVQDSEIQAAMDHYTVSGSMGHLLDGENDTLDLSPFTVFEIDTLMSMGEKNVLPVLLCLFRRFEKALKGQPALLSLDEVWVILGHPVFGPQLRMWLKENRKKNCSILMATQSLSDAFRSNMMDVLQEQCPTKILLPNKEADLSGTKESPGPSDLYKMFGLNGREIEILKNGRYKKDYYYKSPHGRRLFELGLGPLALSFVAVSSKEDVATIKHLEKVHGCDWPLVWLKNKGVNYSDYL